MKVIKKIFSIIILLFCVIGFTGCQSTDKNESYFNHGYLTQATFEYNEETNKTKVNFYAELSNGTIYNINTFTLEFKMFNESNLINTKSYTYNVSIDNGDLYEGNFYFYADGKIDSIEFKSWSATYDSLWKTYKIWFIASIITLAVISLIYIIFMIIEDLELCDTMEFICDIFEDREGLFGVLAVLFAGGALGSIFANWVPVLIILGAIVTFVIIGLMAHLVKFIITSIVENNLPDYTKKDLSELTKEELKDYCRIHNISGFSNLNKDELMELIKFGNKKSSAKNISSNSYEKKSTNSLEELDKLIGLNSVKTQLKRIRAMLLKQKDIKQDLNLHMCFYGNPGTGKTIVARLMANILYETGILPTNKLIETDRSGLCGEYLGQTGPQTHKKVKEAMGGVLFIDEAYTLNSGADDDYGKEAIAALLKDMEDYKGKVCVILAGYKKQMEDMIALNPGFDSRINRKIEFPDYTASEQMQIFDLMISKKQYEITDDAKNKLVEVFEKVSKFKNFANARSIRNILEGLIELQAIRTMEDDDPKNDNERIILIQDVEQYIKENID